jgi:hypothetical protein
MGQPYTSQQAKEIAAAERRDMRWQRLRLKVLDRDGWRCAGCGVGKFPEGVVVHHIEYGRHQWSTPVSLLQALCQDCHHALGEHSRGGVWWERADAEEAGFGKVRLCVKHCPKCAHRDIDLDERGRVRCKSSRCGYAVPLPEHGCRMRSPYYQSTPIVPRIQRQGTLV